MPVEKTKLRRSLFIGLGGTGIKTILKTKLVMMDNYKRGEKLPPIIGFLGIDTNSDEYSESIKSKFAGNVTLTQKERFFIGMSGAVEYLNEKKKYFNWMPQQNTVYVNSVDDTGAGQVRTNGRLAFMFHHQQLEEKLENALNEIETVAIDDKEWSDFEDLGGGAIEVHLIFSLCGGTGSGTFIDVAYLLRELSKKHKLHINGYAVLPDVFKREIKNSGEKQRIEPNAYGAICDLDYLMSLNLRGEAKKFLTSWEDTQKEFGVLPFDSMILVDNKNDTLSYGKMSDLTEMLSLALLATTGQISQTTNSIGINLKTDMEQGYFDYLDKRAWVGSMGASAIIYDRRNVASVYNRRIQNKLIDILLKAGDGVTLASDWIDLVCIREHQRDDVVNALYNMNQITNFVITENDFDKNSVETEVRKRFKQYSDGVDMPDEDWQKRAVAKAEDVKKSLDAKVRSIMNEQPYSIQLAIDFLNSVLSQIEIYKTEMENEQQEQTNLKRNSETDFDDKLLALKNYLSSGIIHRKTSTYLSPIIAYAYDITTARIEIRRRTYALHFYRLVEEAINDTLKHVTALKDSLLSIQRDNNSEIEKRVTHADEVHVVEFDLAEVAFRQLEVDESQITMTNFIGSLPKKDLYQQTSTGDLKHALSTYVESLSTYADVANQTLDDILNKMPVEEFKELARVAFERSKTFLRLDKTSRKVNGKAIGTEEIFYICVPNANNRLTKDNFYLDIAKEADNAKVIPTGLMDRVIIYRQKRPVPAFAISGLTTMETSYLEGSAKVSFHIDEQLRQTILRENFTFEPKEAGLEESLVAWVRGCILGLIKVERNSYMYYDDTKQIAGTNEEVWTTLSTAFRDQAFEKFAALPHLVGQYEEKFEAHLRDLGTTKVLEERELVIKNYLRDYSRIHIAKNTFLGAHVPVEYVATKKLYLQEVDILPTLYPKP